MSEATDWTASPAYVWRESGARGLPAIEAPPLSLLRGIDLQKALVSTNVARLAVGHAAHDMLLWGARGMGKSALLRSSTAAAQSAPHAKLALVQAAADRLASLPALLETLAVQDRNFLVFLDDLGFEDGEHQQARRLRTVLDGGVEARPGNVRIAVTSNRRAIIERHRSEQDDPLNPRDAVDDQLALADRFGLSIGFHACDQEDYLAIIDGYARTHDLPWDRDEALLWARRRGARSGRVAWHFIVELAGRMGRPLPR